MCSIGGQKFGEMDDGESIAVPSGAKVSYDLKRRVHPRVHVE